MLSALALPAAAQTRYPERPVRVVVPVAAAGSTDIIARLTMSRVSELMGRPMSSITVPARAACLAMKILATSGRERAPYLPNVPTLAEAGVKDFETAPWQGLLGPANLPQVIIDTLHAHIREVLKMNDTRDKIGATGTDIVGNTPAEFGRMLARELAQNKKVIEAVGMRAD